MRFFLYFTLLFMFGLAKNCKYPYFEKPYLPLNTPQLDTILNELKANLTEYMTEMQKESMNFRCAFSFQILQNSTTIFDFHDGFIDPLAETGVVNEETMYNIASVSKVFASYMAMDAISQGLVTFFFLIVFRSR